MKQHLMVKKSRTTIDTKMMSLWQCCKKVSNTFPGKNEEEGNQ
jgi:hypothetical protein